MMLMVEEVMQRLMTQKQLDRSWRKIRAVKGHLLASKRKDLDLGRQLEERKNAAPTKPIALLAAAQQVLKRKALYLLKERQVERMQPAHHFVAFDEGAVRSLHIRAGRLRKENDRERDKRASQRGHEERR